MAIEHTGTGDPRKSIELLWGAEAAEKLADIGPSEGPDAEGGAGSGAGPGGKQRKRGPKPRFTVDQIAAIAIDIADRQGLEAVSMRRVADVLGVTAMSLYSYVPAKDELIDVMVDRVYGELETDRTDRAAADGDGADGAAAGWRERLERIARQNWDLNLRHPWLLQVATTRPVMGPNLVAKYDHELCAIEGIGLTDVEMDQTVALVTDYVNGAVRSAVAADEIARRTGQSDPEWWAQYAPLMDRLVDPERYAVGVRVGRSAGEAYDSAVDPARSFEFGLQRLLDGIAAFLRD